VVRSKKSSMLTLSTRDEKIIRMMATTITILFGLVCLIPFMRVLSQAISADKYVLSGQITVYPRDMTLKHIDFVLSYASFTRSMLLSIRATVVFTVCALFMTALLAYPLSRSYLKAGKAMNFYVVFTMLFNGGIVPTYLIVKMLGITNTFWALIIPNLISAYNTIVLVSAFRSVPMEFEEAARVDGAGNLRIMLQIMLPMVKPTLMVLLLWYAVFRWNSWFDAMMYISSTQLRILPLTVRNIIDQGTTALANTVSADQSPTVAVQSAAIIIAVLPILVLYPFIQKYFVKGVMIGGIKG
jgi:putative aldouronate transport system permease protein